MNIDAPIRRDDGMVAKLHNEVAPLGLN